MMVMKERLRQRPSGEKEEKAEEADVTFFATQKQEQDWLNTKIAQHPRLSTWKL